MPKTAQPDENGIVSKISTATMGCKPEIVKGKENGTKAPMYRVFGRATGIKEAKDMNGEAIYGLTGAFEAENLVTNAKARSGVLYLPPGIHEMILGPLDDLLARKDENAMIEFGYDIYTVAASNKSGYTYQAEDLFPQRRVDPFAEMKALIKDQDKPALTDDQKKLVLS